MRIRPLINGCMFSLGVALLIASPGHAAVFNVTGVTDLSGTVTIDRVAGTVTAADLNYSANSPPDYTNIFNQFQNGSLYDVEVTNGTTSPVDMLIIVLENAPTLIGYQGGPILEVLFLGDCNLFSGGVAVCSGPSSNLTTNNPALTATPLPATLPLLAGGLGALGLFGWRRKRKVACAVA